MYKYVYEGYWESNYNIPIEVLSSIKGLNCVIFPDGVVEVLYIANDGLIIGTDVEIDPENSSGCLSAIFKDHLQLADFFNIFYHPDFNIDVKITKEIRDSTFTKKIEDMHLDPMMKPIIRSIYENTNLTTSFSCEGHPEFNATIYAVDRVGDDVYSLPLSAYIVFDQQWLLDIEPPLGWYWDRDDNSNMLGIRRGILGMETAVLRCKEWTIPEVTMKSIRISGTTYTNDNEHSFMGKYINRLGTDYKFECMSNLKEWVDKLPLTIEEYQSDPGNH